ncbi:MAG TPA: hypothetical protein VN457_06365, partial [Chlamydiales bacterium]|nr:hypothetical protein [Chlamydiales bacterium]
GAPFEYLGKALVYEAEKEYAEEIKCYELAMRRFQKHPLLGLLQEQIAFRMHESARENRKYAYEFINLALRFLPTIYASTAAQKLFKSLEKHWEAPFFVFHDKKADPHETLRLLTAFWLAKPYLLEELIKELLERPILPIPIIADALFLMMLLGAEERAKTTIYHIRSLLSEAEQKRLLGCFEPLEALIAHTVPSFQATRDGSRALYFAARRCINQQKYTELKELLPILLERKTEQFDAIALEAAILMNDTQTLKLFENRELVSDESPLYFPLLCLLAKKEGQHAAKEHFSKLLPSQSPRSYILGSSFIAGHIHLDPGGWITSSFLWEKRSLYEQLALFYAAIGDNEKRAAFQMLLLQESTN